MNRRSTLMVCLLVLLVPAIAFSSSGKGEIASSAGMKPSARAAGLDISKEVKIYGYLLGGGAELPGTPAVMDALNAKLKRDLNATMEINWIGWGDFDTKYPLLLAAGQNIDWIFTSPGWCKYEQQASKGAFMEITRDMAKKYAPLFYGNLTDQIWEASKVGDKVYMVTCVGALAGCHLLGYRQDLVEKWNVPAPRKLIDAEPYFDAILRNQPGMIPINEEKSTDIGALPTYLLDNMGYGFKEVPQYTWYIAYDVGDPSGRIDYLFEEPLRSKFKQAATLIKAWYDKGYINKNPFAQSVRSIETFKEDKSGIGGLNSTDIQTVYAAFEGTTKKIGIIPELPGGAAQQAKLCGNGVALSIHSKNPERALRAMDLIMNDPEYMYLAYYGIEGKHYKLTADGRITLIGSDYPIDASGFWFKNESLLKPIDSWPAEYVELRKYLAGVKKIQMYLEFIPDDEPVKTEVANCKQVITQYLMPLFVGMVKDVEEAMQTADSKFKAAGADKVLAEYRKQAAEFRKRMKR